jgi:hypothetical protein
MRLSCPQDAHRLRSLRDIVFRSQALVISLHIDLHWHLLALMPSSLPKAVRLRETL